MVTLESRRIATSSDTELARSIHHAALRDTVLRQFGVWDEKFQNDFFNKDWAVGGFEILLKDQKPCGYWAIDEHPDSITVRELVISPEFQGQGRGTRLLHEIQQKASASFRTVRIGALHLNPALGLYRRLGFKDTGRNETHTLLEWKDNK